MSKTAYDSLGIAGYFTSERDSYGSMLRKEESSQHIIELRKDYPSQGLRYINQEFEFKHRQHSDGPAPSTNGSDTDSETSLPPGRNQRRRGSRGSRGRKKASTTTAKAITSNDNPLQVTPSIATATSEGTTTSIETIPKPTSVATDRKPTVAVATTSPKTCLAPDEAPDKPHNLVSNGLLLPDKTPIKPAIAAIETSVSPLKHLFKVLKRPKPP
ncbi:hypothetical protein GGR57DRAFT_498989 [Xylariaceae sp. FL1272]|nr:hypothetical protein GGR57DRAFT_498989 [Xylariaceae sp. FL1272]